ncbi:hypothetical protein [Polynucleobacter sp. MWH-UH25E]|uniref:hypothetical protein n=1 Tax=Polynucleobacter sp. MWH-UH25E TaxID=1855616 RepID=UPI001BFD10D7|nr:hypothetical protein [Polynucleobacter sp. MWH-UH25E]QWD62580.1 hypothetical protein ICV39_02895 [Polynucleobacter sp. MWH-UH25E]
MRYLLALISFVIIFASSAARADANIYHCEVMSDAYIKSDGSLEVMSDSPRVGQEFTVIKKSGEIVGDVMDSLKNPRIISRGGNGQPYKILWEQKSASKNGIYVDYLSIDNVLGKEEKPFGFFSGSMLLAGICR